MPPRLNKRQQRELEELEALGGPSDPENSSEDDVPIITKKPTAGFSNVSVIASASNYGFLRFSVAARAGRYRR
jgi:hypothetical protein